MRAASLARLASTSAEPSNTAPQSVTTRAPQRSLAAPQPNEPKAMTRKLIVIAKEMPARDQPVSVGHRRQEDRQRKHRADGDAAHQAAQRDDDPAVRRLRHPFTAWLRRRTGMQICTAELESCGLKDSSYLSRYGAETCT